MNKQHQISFLKAFDSLAPKLYRFCLLRVSSKPLAEDLVSQTFLQTWQYLRNGQEIKFYPVFLYKVLRRLIADYWRSKSSKTISLEMVSAETFTDPQQIPEEISKNMEIKEVVDALSQLPQDQQEIIHWRFVDGLSIKEIAELSGKKNNAIYVCIHRSIQKLKETFKNNYV